MSASGAARPLDGEEGLRQRAVLVIVPLLLLAFVLGHALATAWRFQSSAAAFALAGAPLASALLLAIRERRVAAAWLALGTTLVLLTRLMYVGEGFADVVVIGWPALVLAAGLLLERRDLYLFAIGSVAACAWIAALELQGRLPRRDAGDSPALLELGVLVMVLALTTVAVDVLILGLRRNLSEALAAARALRASEERFNRAFQASPAAMVLTRLSDRTVLDANEAFLRKLGRRRDEVVGRPTVEEGFWIDPRDREQVYQALAESGGFREMLVHYRRHPEDRGQALVSGWVAEIGGEPCALFIALDVSDRLNAEAALAASEERYRLISKLISDYTFSTRVDADGSMHLEWVAGAFEQISGYSFDEYVARGGWRAALHPDDLELDDVGLARMARRETVQLDVRTLVPGGAVRWVRVYGHPVWDEDLGRLVRIHGAVKDITDQKQAELDREELIAQLEAKNAELERFTYTVSHDLKSPLLTIRGFLGHVASAIARGDAAGAADDLDRIREASTRMGRLLDELLELSRIGRVVSPPVEAPFAELAREAVSLCRGRLEPRDAEVRIQPDLPRVWGDRSRLVEVLQNLIDNAVKFTPPERRPQIEIGARTDAGDPILFVADQGMGLDPDHRSKIFGLFDKLDPASEGTGIGLALVERIVQVHGGEIWVESEGVDRGCRFCFRLPGAPDG